MAPIVLCASLPIAVAIFALYPPRRALLVVFFAGWLFLPMATISFEGVPDYNKNTAITCSVLLGVVLFDLRRLLAFRPRWLDLPMLIWCICPLVSAITNQVGASLAESFYGGVTNCLDHVILWGIPYLLGRVYFTTHEHLCELAVAFFLASVVYLPLCMIEIRFSPQMHNWFYGYHQHHFAGTKRYGGFRPMVFMQHGLMLGLFLTNGCVLGFWLWQSGLIKRVWVVPMWLLMLIQLGTTVFSKSTAALGLLVAGGGCMVASRWSGSRIFLGALVLMGPIYMVLRATGVWTGESLYRIATHITYQERAESLQGRMINEDLFAEKALGRPFFGWSRWNRFQVYDDWGNLLTTPDGLWVIALGQFGFTGLSSVVTLLLLPASLLMWRYRAGLWWRPAMAPAAALAMVLVLFLLDCVLNAMINHVYLLIVGALITVLPRIDSVPRHMVHPIHRPVLVLGRQRSDLS